MTSSVREPDSSNLEEPPELDQAPSHRNVRGFFGRDMIYTVLWASQMGMATVLTAVVTRILGPSHYGIAAACITVMQLVSAIAGFGLQTGIQRAHAHKGDEAARRLVTLAMLIAAVVYLIVALTGPLWSNAVGLGSFSGAPQYAVAWAACTAATNAVLGLLRSRDQLAAFAVVNVLQTALAEALSLLLILVVARTASEYILGELLGQAAALVVGLGLTRPLPLRRRDLGLATDTLKFCAPLVPAMVATFVLNASDRLVVNAYVGHEELARYAVASNIGSIPTILITSLALSWMPRVFAMSSADDLVATLRRTRDLLYLLLVPLVVGIGVASPLLLRLLAPPSFDPDGLQLEVAVIVAAVIPFAGATTHERLLLARDRSRPTAVATIVAALFNLALNFVLVPMMGIIGAAIATLMAACLMNFMLGRAADAVLHIPHPRIGLILFVGAGLALVFGFSQVPTSLAFLVLRAIVVLIAAVLGLVLLRLFARGSDHHANGRLSAWLAARADVLL